MVRSCWSACWPVGPRTETGLQGRRSTRDGRFFLPGQQFAVWLFGLSLANAPYAKTFSGLAECYVAALPFLRGTVIGDWAFMAVFALTAVLVRHLSAERQRELASEAHA